MIRDKRGISKLELIVALAIIGILAGLVSLGSDLIRRERIASASRELFADLMRARLFAMTKESHGYGVRLDPGGYVLFKFSDCNDDYAYDVSACSGGSEEDGIHAGVLPSGITLGKTHPGNIADSEVIIFDRFGTPRTRNWAFALLTIIVRGDREDDPIYCIVVSRNRVRDGVWGWDAAKKDYGCVKQ